MVRMLDPKWGIDTQDMLNEFNRLHTRFFISGREIDGKFITRHDIKEMLPEKLGLLFDYLSFPVGGKWDISSTELRNKLL
jgi:hypothetical protein